MEEGKNNSSLLADTIAGQSKDQENNLEDVLQA